MQSAPAVASTWPPSSIQTSTYDTPLNVGDLIDLALLRCELTAPFPPPAVASAVCASPPSKPTLRLTGGRDGSDDWDYCGPPAAGITTPARPDHGPSQAATPAPSTSQLVDVGPDLWGPCPPWSQPLALPKDGPQPAIRPSYVASFPSPFRSASQADGPPQPLRPVLLLAWPPPPSWSRFQAAPGALNEARPARPRPAAGASPSAEWKWSPATSGPGA